MTALRPDLAEAVLKLETRLPQASVLLSSRHGMSIVVDQREENISQLPRAAGAVVSGFDGTTLHERSVAGFHKERLLRAAGELAESIAGSRLQPPAASEPRREDFATAAAVPVGSLSLQDKLERCRDLQRRLAAIDSRIVNARVTYAEMGEASVYRSRTADRAQAIQRVRLSVLAVISDGTGVRYDWKSKGGSGGWELIDYSDDELQRVVDGAVRLLSAERIEPGEYTVVSGPGVSGVLAHESFGHGVETDLFPKDRARAVEFLGRQVGSELVTILDDPSLPAGYSSYFFDDEGMLASPSTIVERGVFRGGITDLVSAATLGIHRTANGRRQDYTRKPYARMSNTFFGPGDTPLDDMLAQVDSGVFLDRWVNGMEDPQGWGIQITCHYGQEIRNGRITDRVFAPVSLSGYVPTVLGTIRAASPEVAMDQGTCGKGHKEYVVNSSGGPNLLFKVNLG